MKQKYIELPYHSVFRELDDKNTNEDMEFLSEIDRQQQIERENDYKNQLQQLWNVYGRQQNKISGGGEILTHLNNNVHRPIMEKRQLILPWLPASRRKRFRVVKRSPINNVKKFINVSAGTNETVTKELRSLFGPTSLDERRKRSNTGQKQISLSSPAPPPPGEILNGAITSSTNSHKTFENESHKEDCKTDHDHSEDHKHQVTEHEINDSQENSEELSSALSNENTLKSKRSYRSGSNIIPFRKKKAIQWSKYLGLDRRKKSDSWENKK